MSVGPPSPVVRLVAAFSEGSLQRAHARLADQQAAMLGRIVRRYRDTELGSMVGLAGVDSAASFRAQVSPRTGDDYLPLFRSVLVDNRPGRVHPEPIRYAGLSSGSTGEAKPIPLPREALDAYRRFTNHAFFHAFRTHGVYDVLAGNLLVAAGPAVKETSPAGVLVGFGSGIASLEAPRFARRLIRPTAPVQALLDRDEKLARIAEEALAADVRAVTGMPNAAIPMIERVLEAARAAGREAPTLRALFPRLRFYAYSGMALGPHEARLRALLGDGVPMVEVYSSNESPIAFQAGPEGRTLLFDPTVVVLELLPVDAPDAPRIGAADAEPGRTYEVVVTTPGGLCAYRLGDLVRIVSTHPLTFEFAGRVRDELSFAGEKLPLATFVETLRAVLADASHDLGPFVVLPPADGAPPGAELWLELRDDVSLDGVARALDAALSARHATYALMRGHSNLAAPRLRRLAPGTLELALHRAKTFGHAKLPALQRDRRALPSIEAAHAALLGAS